MKPLIAVLFWALFLLSTPASAAPIWILFALKDSKIGKAESLQVDIPLNAFSTREECEAERLNGDFADSFSCVFVSERDASSLTLLFAGLGNCDESDKRCVDLRDQQDALQRIRYPRGLIEKGFNHLFD